MEATKPEKGRNSKFEESQKPDKLLSKDNYQISDLPDAVIDSQRKPMRDNNTALLTKEGEMCTRNDKKSSGRGMRKRIDLEPKGAATQTSSSTTTSFETTPKRSMSEAPSNNAVSDVLYQVHLKLINRARKLSPTSVLAKQIERHQKAEHLRAKIEHSRQEWAAKVNRRQQLAQQIARTRLHEDAARKQRRLQEKLQQAARNKEAELQNVVERAKAENLKAEETNFFNKLTKENQQLDLDNKLQEVEERRRMQQMRELEKKKEQELRREAADKRRQELNEELKTKIMTKALKREEAEQRRRDQRIADKNKAQAEKDKREMVRARKIYQGHKLSDILTFVNHRESLWEFIGMESDLDQMGLCLNLQDTSLRADDEIFREGELNDKDLLKMIQKDQFELEKLMLKRDLEILNNCIQIDDDGNLKILFNPISLINTKDSHREASPESFNSEDLKFKVSQQEQPNSGKGSNRRSNLKSASQFNTNKKEIIDQQPLRNSALNSKRHEVKLTADNSKKATSKQNSLILSQNSQQFSDSVSPFEKALTPKTVEREAEEEKGSEHVALSETSQLFKDQLASEKLLDLKLQQQKMKMSIRRNILRRTVSEDLEWAEYLKTDPSFEMFRWLKQSQNCLFSMETRSQHSSPERKLEESLEDYDPRFFNLDEVKKGVEQEDTPQKNTKSSKANQGNQKKKKQAKHAQITLNIKQENQNVQNSYRESLGGGPLLSSSRNTKRGSISDLKQLKTLSRNGSCSSLSSLIVHKTNVGDEFNDTPMQSSGTLNQQQLDSLGPVMKMTLNGFPITSIRNQTTLSVNSGNNFDRDDDFLQSSTASLFSASSQQAPSFNLNAFLLNQRIQLPKTHYFNSIHNYNQNLSKNANLYLFPIREQKIILMYPDKDKEFDIAHAKISLKMTEVKLFSEQSHSLKKPSLQDPSDLLTTTLTCSPTNKQPNSTLTPSKLKQSSQTPAIVDSLKTPTKPSSSSQPQQTHQQQHIQSTPTENSHTITTGGTSARNTSATPQTTTINTSESQYQQQQQQQLQQLRTALPPIETPTSLFSDQQQSLLLPHDHDNTTELDKEECFSKARQFQVAAFVSHQKKLLEPDSPLSCSNNLTDDVLVPDGAEEKKGEGGKGVDSGCCRQRGVECIGDDDDVKKEEEEICFGMADHIEESKSKVSGGNNSDGSQQSDRMVDLIVKKLLIDQAHYIRIDDSQKSILIEGSESSTVLRYLEVNELRFKYCRLCEVAIYREYSTETEVTQMQNAIHEHFTSKNHIRKRESLNIKEAEDHTFSMLIFSSQPGDIEQELRLEKEKALKRKVKRLKQQMQTLAVNHENASTYPGKELKSSNKNRLQIRCMEMEKSVFPAIKNYETVEAIMNDILKVLEKRGVGDLHLMRKLKFMPILTDICKRISICPKGELKLLARVISLSVKIISKFCTKRENRNYMLQTNRLMPLVDLFAWCLNRQTELFFGIDFMPSLFHIITTHLKHRVPYECQQMKELLVDYLISSSITQKIRQKLSIVKQFQSNKYEEEELGQVPLFLLKSVTFLEALTAMISIDARTRPVYERSDKIGEHVFFVLQNTELFGVVQMITTLLLTINEAFKASAPTASDLVLPQTILSLAVFCIKVLNNIVRMDCALVQQMLVDQNEQLYHLLNFILSYAETNIDTVEDVKELLHETLLFIGYFCLIHDQNQKMLHRGQNSILQKLCNLPFTYFFDKKLKDILFPTLITVSYQNSRSLAILDQEMDLSVIVKYLDVHIKEVLPGIMEQEQEYFSDHTKSISSIGKPHNPKSISSTGSNSAQSVQMDFLTGNNPYLPLVMRFPKHLWKDAVAFYRQQN